MKKGAFSHIDPWYPIFKGEGKEYAEQMKNIFLGYGVKGLSGYTFDSKSCYYFIDKDGYVGTYLPIFKSEENEFFLKKFKNNIINIKEFLTIK